jgi:release factor glutamine methyltransferase
MVLVAEALASLRDRLAVAGVPSPDADAELLLGSLLGLSRGELVVHAQLGKHISAAVSADLEPLVQRREAREPLQHIVGRAPFMNFEVEVGPGVFIPRPETESLAERAIALAQSIGVDEGGLSIVDVCSGSGVLAISLARAVPWASVVALELSPEAMLYLQRNVSRLAPSAAVVCASVTDFGKTVAQSSLDMIVANPPYIPDSEVPNDPEVFAHDPHLALFGGSDGLDVVREIVALALHGLRPGGVIMMEHSNLQGAAVAELLATNGFRTIHTEQDLLGRDRFTHAIAP